MHIMILAVIVFICFWARDMCKAFKKQRAVTAAIAVVPVSPQTPASHTAPAVAPDTPAVAVAVAAPAQVAVVHPWDGVDLETPAFVRLGSEKLNSFFKRLDEMSDAFKQRKLADEIAALQKSIRSDKAKERAARRKAEREANDQSLLDQAAPHTSI